MTAGSILRAAAGPEPAGWPERASVPASGGDIGGVTGGGAPPHPLPCTTAWPRRGPPRAPTDAAPPAAPLPRPSFVYVATFLNTRRVPHWHDVGRPRQALDVQHERVAGEPLTAEFERPRALAPLRARRLEEYLPSRGVAHHDLRAFAERDGAVHVDVRSGSSHATGRRLPVDGDAAKCHPERERGGELH